MSNKKLSDKEWEGIRYNLVETGFFDFEARPKTLKAVRRVIEHMSDDEIETLQEGTTIIFAPAPGKYGEVYPFLATGQGQGTVMVYLSPQLEPRSQQYVESVVAHEFAHILLHPLDQHHPQAEHEADEKAQAWGFRPAYRQEEYPVC